MREPHDFVINCFFSWSYRHLLLFQEQRNSTDGKPENSHATFSLSADCTYSQREHAPKKNCNNSKNGKIIRSLRLLHKHQFCSARSAAAVVVVMFTGSRISSSEIRTTTNATLPVHGSFLGRLMWSAYWCFRSGILLRNASSIVNVRNVYAKLAR